VSNNPQTTGGVERVSEWNQYNVPKPPVSGLRASLKSDPCCLHGWAARQRPQQAAYEMPAFMSRSSKTQEI